MQNHLTRIAFAAGLVAAATSALADPAGANRPVSNYTSGPGVTDIYLAGSSAVDLVLTKQIANNCTDGSLDSYRTDAGGKTYYLWTCETSSTSGFQLASGNTKLAIHKNTNSSSDGTNAVAVQTSLAYLQVSDLTGTSVACNLTTFASTPNIPSYNYFVCGTTAGNAGVGTFSRAPDFGFSDSEPAQFANPTTNAGLLTTAYPLTVMFGVPVTKVLRDALQKAQGLTVGGEAEADMPSIGSSTINLVFTGQAGTLTAAGLPTVQSDGVTPWADTNIYRVRRSDGSGTTRAFNMAYIGNFCVASDIPQASATTLVTANIPTQCNTVGAGGVKAGQAGTSDDMAACLASYNTKQVPAIGYLSTDYQPGAADGYRWVKVDGYSPSAINLVDGKWRMWSEESINYNTAVGLPGDTASFYNSIKVASTNNAEWVDIVSSLGQTTSGQWTGAVLSARSGGKNPAGWGIAPSAAVLANTRTAATLLSFPQNPHTHQNSGAYSLCAPARTANGWQPK